jgi:hypothetical protein
MRINKPTIDKYIKLIVNKVAYNRRVNQLIKPFKVELISKHFDKNSFAQLQLDGNIGEVKIQKVTRPYVDLEKLLANSKDAKKYVTYKTSYRLTAKQFEAELNAEAQADAA